MKKVLTTAEWIERETKRAEEVRRLYWQERDEPPPIEQWGLRAAEHPLRVWN